MTDIRVFIHTNESQLLGAKVAAYSFKKLSGGKVTADLIELKNHPVLTSKEGRTYLRKGRKATWINSDLQSFSPLRFLPPQLMSYQGIAIVTDPDVFAVSADIAKLGELFDFNQKPIWARQVNSGKYTGYAKSFFGTSVMLLNCAKLTHWKWDDVIENLFAKKFDYGDWIGLKLEDQASIGILPDEWNSFDYLDANTKLLHMTERSTQPWKTGLARDFDTTGELTLKLGTKAISPAFMFRKFKQQMGWVDFESGNFYKPHPDPNQQKFFFLLLLECLKENVFDEKYVQHNIERGFVRPDIMRVLDTVATQALEKSSSFPVTNL